MTSRPGRLRHDSEYNRVWIRKLLPGGTVKANVGFIGLGLRGRPMVENLLKKGFPVTVWNRTASRAEESAKLGAKVAATPREAAAAADVLVTIVSDPPAVEQVLWGK